EPPHDRVRHIQLLIERWHPGRCRQRAVLPVNDRVIVVFLTEEPEDHCFFRKCLILRADFVRPCCMISKAGLPKQARIAMAIVAGFGTASQRHQRSELERFDPEWPQWFCREENVQGRMAAIYTSRE